MRKGFFVVFSSIIIAVFFVTPSTAENPPKFTQGLKSVQLDHTFPGQLILAKGHFLTLTRGIGSSVGESSVGVFDNLGFQVFEAFPGLDIPETALIGLRSSTLRTVDRLVVAAAIRSSKSQHASVLLEYDLKTGELIHVVKTDPIQCDEVFGDDSGTIWCLGYPNKKQDEFDLVYRFDESGTLVGSSVPRSTFLNSSMPWRDTDGSWAGFVGDTSVSLWLPQIREIVTLSQDGSIFEHIDVPESTGTVVGENVIVSRHGDVYALIVKEDPSGDEIVYQKSLSMVARGESDWDLVGGAPGQIDLGVSLLGSDEDGLVFYDTRDRRAFWFATAHTPEEP